MLGSLQKLGKALMLPVAVLPAAALAMYTTSRSANRKAVAGILLSVALTAFLTGITEPIEFAFMFLAPVLYVAHSVLTGLSLAVCELLGVHHGFGFSAGAIDYVLNYGLSTKGWMLLPLGLVFAALYYFLFVLIIRAMNLPTPGREADATGMTAKASSMEDLAELAAAYMARLGGPENVEQIDACITRLRLTLKDSAVVEEAEIKALGATGLVRPSARVMQIVIGTKAELLADAMRRHLKKR